MALFDEIYTNIDPSNVAAANKTGTGKFVLQTSPTILTPTIASFTNAQHNHSDAANGGKLDWDQIWSDAVHDHSSAAEGGNIPEASITDGAILARVAANETISGSWTFPSTNPPAANATTRGSLVKAWASVAVAGPSYDDSYNFSGSPTKDAVGKYTLTFGTAFANNDYAVVVTGVSTTQLVSCVVRGVGTTAVSVNIFDSTGTLADFDFRIICIGDQ